MKPRNIPRVPPVQDPERRGFDEAVKERLEILFGSRGVKIEALNTATATTEQCASKINEILALLQG